MMSSLSDSHSTRAETSRTSPVTSMAMTLTGMATVLPVRIAVLMISVSCREGGALMSWGAYGGHLLSHDRPAKAQAPGAPAPQMRVLLLGTPARMCGEGPPPSLTCLLRCCAHLASCHSLQEATVPPGDNPSPVPHHLLSTSDMLLSVTSNTFADHSRCPQAGPVTPAMAPPSSLLLRTNYSRSHHRTFAHTILSLEHPPHLWLYKPFLPGSTAWLPPPGSLS